MRFGQFAERLLGTTSALTLSAVALIGTLQPALAWQNYATVYAGGSTLPSQALRQLFDCYAGTTIPGDGFSFSTSFGAQSPSPGLLPQSCELSATPFEGLFAGVGSGNGLRSFISNKPDELFRGNPKSLPAVIYNPTKLPPFVDPRDSLFASYPYPRIDITTSDAPLGNAGANSLRTVSFSEFTPTTNWQAASLITAASATLASYKSATYGQPIQVPALEVPVAIAVNVHDPLRSPHWQIQSALSPNTQAGGAIQLSTAQICAIFSGTVTDWGDTTTLIPYLDQNGVQLTQHFYDDNTNGNLTPKAYVNGSLPIKIVFRVDDSGTGYILTNYLANACPLLDPTGTYNYKKIFTGIGIDQATVANLPSGEFRKLIGNIRKVTGVNHDDPYTVDSDAVRSKDQWVSALGSADAAIKIGTNAAYAGRLGYVSADFTQPYATTVTEKTRIGDVTVPAPLSASIQNENQRESGVYHPGQTGSFDAPQNFVAPTPDGAQTAFSQLTPPSSPTSYVDWNVYAQTYEAGTTLGGVSFGGLSQIALSNQDGAYPITGVSFLQVYSCYADSNGTRVPGLTNWLAWFFGGSDAGLPAYSPANSNASLPGYDPNVALIIRNNGFHELDPNWSTSILANYVTPSSAGGSTTAIAALKTSSRRVDGCLGVTGGAK